MNKAIFERKESQGMEDRKIQNFLEGFKAPTAVQTCSAGVVHIFHVPPRSSSVASFNQSILASR